jgi:SAM-dependent methyltransferase
MSADVHSEISTQSGVESGTRSHTLLADRASLTLEGPPIPAEAILSVRFGDRPIWSLRVGEVVRPGPGISVIDWPPALAGRLSGWARLTVLFDGTPLCEAVTVTFDDSPHQFALEEPGTGMPQIVNKWGRIARNFDGLRAHLIDEALDEAVTLVEWMRGHGHALFVTGGTLLGPVRDGRIMPGDDDVDLAYLSRHQNPSDIALEGFELERALHASGYETVRHSAGHLQVLFPGADGTDRFYLDIFTYFTVAGWFYGTFHARERVDKVNILPLRTLVINGREFPAPAQPEQMLAAIYGPGWRTPDPAFRFITPAPARRRYDSWLGSLDGDRENWEDHHRELLRGVHSGTDSGTSPSAWAQELTGELARRSSILELGCGLGADARHFAEHGHDVVAVDYSRPAIESLRGIRSESGSLQARRVNLNSVRETAPLAGLVRQGDTPLLIFARLLLNYLNDEGTANTLMLVRHLLRNRKKPAAAYLEFQASDFDRPFPDSRYHAAVDAERLTSSLEKLGLYGEDVTPRPERQGGEMAATRRLKVRAVQ